MFLFSELPGRSSRLLLAPNTPLVNRAGIRRRAGAAGLATQALAPACASRPAQRIFPRSIVFLGPPGVGKGSYAAYFSKKRGIPHISTGDIIRGGQTEALAALANQGTLLSDETMNALVQDRLGHSDVRDSGYILDGYPRTLPQAEALNQHAPPDVCIELTLPEHILLQKIKGRRTCKECGHMYNVAHICEAPYDMPALRPKTPDLCDKCLKPLELIQRPDDALAIAQKRLQDYEATTREVANYYRAKKCCLRTFSIRKGMKDAPCLEQVIMRFYSRRVRLLDSAPSVS